VKKRTDAGRGVLRRAIESGVAGSNCRPAGADLRGAVAGASNLVNVTDRMDDDNIRSVINTSRDINRCSRASHRLI
jgi:hypothetical protein